MRGQQGNGMGARRRYLQEQNEFLESIGQEPISKAVKATEFESGQPYERFSAERQRRRSAVTSSTYNAGAATAGAAGLGLAAGRVGGSPLGQRVLRNTARMSPNSDVRAAALAAANKTKVLGKRPITSAAGAAGLGVTAVGLRTLGRFRRSEEEGMSQGIGRLKAGETYSRRQNSVAKGLMVTASREISRKLAEGDPQVARVARLVAEHRKGLAQTGAVTGTAAAGLTGYKQIKDRRDQTKQLRAAVTKRDNEPLRTSISRDDAKRLSRQYGLKGPLPKGLTREQKMAAYEARYVSAGGSRAERWQRRAERSEKIRTAGVVAGVAAGGAYLGAKAGLGRPASRLVGRTPLRRINRNHLETAGVAVGTLTGAAEIDAMRARRKRSSYASAPGGVAASALRRMKAYTPEERTG